MSRIIVITGTDTGVGKTLLTALLAAHLVRKGEKVVALKPVCSGGREDALALFKAQGGCQPLDTINPWHFRAPIAPLLAARQEQRRVRLPDLIRHIQTATAQSAWGLIEGAGGLLSPLGEGFSTLDLIRTLKAEVFVVGSNRLGVINQLRLTLRALPTASARRAKVLLMAPAQPDSATGSNAELLAEFIEADRIKSLPYFARTKNLRALLTRPKVNKTLAELLGTDP